VNIVTTGDKQSLPRPDEENSLKENLKPKKKNSFLQQQQQKKSRWLSFLNIHEKKITSDM
jgi:hypothetical protein